MARQSQAAADRRNFWLYIDEFDHFISPSMAAILTGARKYRLGMTLAHQELHQLQSEPKVASAVNASICTRIVLRVGDDDAKKLADGFESFDAKSLKNLEKYHAIARIERNDWDFNLALRKPELPSPEEADRRKADVVTASRAKYGTPRAEVEAAWLASLGLAAPINEPPENGGVKPKPTPVKPTPPASAAAEVPKAPEPPKPSEVTKHAIPETCETPNMVRDLGRGGAQHQAIQKRIKEAAEALGFRSVIEKPVLDGLGSVDLFLERQGQRIACEISISTTIDHEVGNVAKCLKAGLPSVAVICLSEERLQKIRQAVSGSMGAEAAERVEYFQPDPFIAHLKALQSPTPQSSEGEFNGYKIRRSIPKLSAKEQQQKEDISNRIMADALRRK
jgi:hypothetical protein